ncbi:Na+/H+ antiporter subunit D [Chelativorans sp. YIM 93263]|uniref:Na+/H+ antiporter subunit D n=1 Tax=Chelativorans sp. YIM 93263 TaxID=2906648 RepID=UPI002377DE10|nr:Na+/H+ antiporter subunit D [Chelativorans sp. YIM 93263]
MAVETEYTADLSGAMVLEPVPLADWLVVAPVAIPLVVGGILLVARRETRMHGWLAAGGLLATLVCTVLLLMRVLEQGIVVMTMGRWLPPFGISFVADPLGASFAVAGTLVAVVCAFYATSDIGTVGRRYGYYALLILMMAGVNGAFLTGDMFNLYVWFEVFLISSFGLLVMGSERRQLDGATKYAILNLIGTTFFLIATAYLYGIFGTLNMADVARKAGDLRDTAPLMTLTVLYLLAFAMKAAAFPVNFWLPASYHTPRIVTSALFGAVLTKVGIYGLLRTFGMLFPPELEILSVLIAWVAAATMILGIMGALAQTDIRRALGFVVISGIGIMLAGIAIGTPEGFAGTVFYALHSMIVLGALYLLAGVMNSLGGSYSLRDLGGLYAARPLIAAFALFLVLSIAGLPPASGLWPKVMLVQASLESGWSWLGFTILLTGFLTTVALGRVFILAIWRPLPENAEPIKAGMSPALGYGVLTALSLPMLIIGLYPDPVIGLAESAAGGLIDATTYIGTVFPEGAAQ